MGCGFSGLRRRPRRWPAHELCQEPSTRQLHCPYDVHHMPCTSISWTFSPPFGGRRVSYMQISDYSEILKENMSAVPLEGSQRVTDLRERICWVLNILITTSYYIHIHVIQASRVCSFVVLFFPLFFFFFFFFLLGGGKAKCVCGGRGGSLWWLCNRCCRLYTLWIVK